MTYSKILPFRFRKTSFTGHHDREVLHQAAIFSSDLLTLPPLIANPDRTLALGQSFFMSPSLRPIALPS